MGLFSRKPKGIAVLPPPVGLDNKHNFGQPGKYVNPNAVQSYAPRPARAFGSPQHEPLDPPEYRPPSGSNPAAWWHNTNRDRIERGAQELVRTQPIVEVTDNKNQVALNPWLYTTPSPRVTSTHSPSTYSFTRPFDQDLAHALNGTHYSQASQSRGYPLGGMEPVSNLRNTFRITPPNRDSENMDLISVYAPAPDPAIYVSPAPTNSEPRWR